jgi:DNA-directed RNA polymerase specialized sigma24 family protein
MSTGQDIEQYEDMICAIVRKFERRYGGDPADLLQNARLAFLQALETFDPSRGDFGPRAWFVINRELFEHVRTAARRGSILKIWTISEIKGGDKNGDEVLESWNDDLRWDPVDPHSASKFDLLEFMDGLSGDAADIVDWIFSGGPDVGLARNLVASHFRGLGWATSRIQAAFSEIEIAIGTA